MRVVGELAFAAGTRELAKAVSACRGVTVAAGGGMMAAIRRAGVADELGYFSRSGRVLEALEGRQLPGVAARRELAAAQPATVVR